MWPLGRSKFDPPETDYFSATLKDGLWCKKLLDRVPGFALNGGGELLACSRACVVQLGIRSSTLPVVESSIRGLEFGHCGLDVVYVEPHLHSESARIVDA